MNLQKEYKKSTNAMATKLKRMASHREELAKKYWQMKKDSNSGRSRTQEYLAVMVDASQDATKVGTCRGIKINIIVLKAINKKIRRRVKSMFVIPIPPY